MSKRVSRLLFTAVGAMAALVLGIVSWVIIGSRDVAPPDTSDLVPDRVVAPDQENAYRLFEEAFKPFQWPKDDRVVDAMLDGEKWDETYVADLISRNGKTLALLKQGLACPHYQPCDKPARDNLNPPWQRHNKMAKLLALKTAQELRAGHAEVAREDSCDLLRFGSLVQANPGRYVDCAIGVIAIQRGLAAVRRLWFESAPDEAQLLWFSDRMGETVPLGRGWIKAIKIEYEVFSGAIDKVCLDTMSKRTILGDYLFHPNRTKANCARFYRTMIENFSRPYGEADLPATDLNALEGWRRLLLLRPNGMARLCIPRPDFLNGFLAGRCAVQSHLDGLRLVVACRLYELRHGRLPETLNALVPELLPAVPPDPFDGKPFRYSRADRVVYSVGKDLKDSWVLGDHAAEALSASHSPTKADDLVYSLLTPQRNEQPGRE